jgi:hypothetical protein
VPSSASDREARMAIVRRAFSSRAPSWRAIVRRCWLCTPSSSPLRSRASAHHADESADDTGCRRRPDAGERIHAFGVFWARCQKARGEVKGGLSRALPRLSRGARSARRRTTRWGDEGPPQLVRLLRLASGRTGLQARSRQEPCQPSTRLLGRERRHSAVIARKSRLDIRLFTRCPGPTAASGTYEPAESAWVSRASRSATRSSPTRSPDGWPRSSLIVRTRALIVFSCTPRRCAERRGLPRSSR